MAKAAALAPADRAVSFYCSPCTIARWIEHLHKFGLLLQAATRASALEFCSYGKIDKIWQRKACLPLVQRRRPRQPQKVPLQVKQNFCRTCTI